MNSEKQEGSSLGYLQDFNAILSPPRKKTPAFLSKSNCVVSSLRNLSTGMWINYGKGEGKRVELENIKRLYEVEGGWYQTPAWNSQSMSPTNNPNQTKPNQYLSRTQLNFFHDIIMSWKFWNEEKNLTTEP